MACEIDRLDFFPGDDGTDGRWGTSVRIFARAFLEEA